MIDKFDLNAYSERELKTLPKIAIRSHLSIKDNPDCYKSKFAIEHKRPFLPLDRKRYCNLKKLLNFILRNYQKDFFQSCLIRFVLEIFHAKQLFDLRPDIYAK